MTFHKTKNFVATLVIFASLTGSAMANANGSLQMLPPTPPTNPNATCVGGSPAQLLAYSGAANGAINCMPGTIDPTGNITIYGSSTLNGYVAISKDLNVSQNATVDLNLNVKGSTDISQNLNVGGNLTVTGTINMPSNTLTIKGQEVTDVTVKTANNLAIAIASCPQGGGTITVDANGSLTCVGITKTNSPTSFYMTATGNWAPIVNPVTGGLSCPSETVDHTIYWFSSGGDNHVFTLHSCTSS